MPEHADYGSVHQITVRADPENADFYNLTLVQETGQKRMLRASAESLRSLWSYITKIIYPHGSNLTKRIDTVKRDAEDVPPDVTHTITAYVNDNDADTIIITGSSREVFWTFQMTREACENLWTGLEDKLNQV